MLVLTRKVGEELYIGDQICVKVMEISGSRVRLGIDAPASMRIYREEVLAKVKNENRFAAEWDLSDFQRVVEHLPKNSREQ
jgi:carbon storage regulator